MSNCLEREMHRNVGTFWAGGVVIIAKDGDNGVYYQLVE